jgi:flagellar biosynthetic protein FlhB
MAEGSTADKTEQPTAERLRKAREEGQIPQSQEVGTALMVLGLVIALALGGPGLLRWSLGQMEGGLNCDAAGGPAGIASVLQARAIDGLLAIAPFALAAAAVALLGSLISGGWNFAPRAVRWDVSRLSPGRALRETFSMRSGVQILAGLAKLTLLCVLSWRFLQDRLAKCLTLRWASTTTILGEISSMALGLIARLAAGLLLIAALELLYQRLHYKRRLRMSRQEVKEERRRYEAAPEVRARVRSIQIQMARRRMLKDVPRADVVLANPTHYAVALKYDGRSMKAPVVLAKGADFLAEKIKEVARANAVPVLERPELARTLHDAALVGEAIPEALFVAVAEVLALIYRLRGKALT